VLGESVVEATVGQWSKAEGEAVRKDEVLVELETDKITVEVAAPQDGVLGSIARREGEIVGVNELLGTLSAGEPSNGGAPAAAEPKAAAEAAPAKPSGDEVVGQSPSSSEERGAQTSPAARAIAAEHGIELSTIR